MNCAYRLIAAFVGVIPYHPAPTLQVPWLLYVLLAVAVAAAIYRYLRWRWQMQLQLRLESQEKRRLKHLNELRTTLYNNIAHEFRTPLTLISGPVDRQLGRVNITDQDRQELGLIKCSSERLLRLVNQMMDLSKLERGRGSMAVAEGDLSVLLQQLADSFAFKMERAGLVFSHCIPKLTNVWFDRDVIDKITTNLLENAVKYTPESGIVHLETSKVEAYVTIAVRNTNHVLTDSELSKLFEWHYKARENNGGLGIGLTLVKELAQLSHGRTVVTRPRPDEVEFAVELPVERSYYTDDERVSETNEATDSFSVDTAKPRSRPNGAEATVRGQTFAIHPEFAASSPESAFLNRLKTVCETHIADPTLTAERLAVQMLMSRTQLHRRLRAVFGISTTEFIRTQRIKLACDLLVGGQVETVSEIAYQVGFSTVSYFNKCFKEQMQCTPNEYLQKEANRVTGGLS